MSLFNVQVCLLLVGFFGTAYAADFPAPYNSEKDLSVPLMPASEAVKSIQLPEGFSAALFAAEPMVQNPIAMTWDARGRLWVAENYTYAERSQRFDLSLRDRIIVLEDTDGDGQADQRTVFADDLQMVTGLEVGYGGVWVMTPPHVLFFHDRNGDDRPDGTASVILDGFEVAQENYHNFANGLKFGPDGWLYGRCGASCPGRIGRPGTPDDERLAMVGTMWRYHPQTAALDVLTSGTTNPWGHDWNEVGECFFVNTVNGHLWHMIPGAHYVRPHTLDPNRRSYEQIDMHADHWHFDTGKSWTDSRNGAANEYGGGHAHIGCMIYQGDNWPDEYRGKLFTLNMHGRRANMEILEREGSGYVARHGKDMILSGDPWFRGMELSYGPDGAVYIIDWSDTGECHDSTGVHRESGRVNRIGYGQVPEKEFQLSYDGSIPGGITLQRGQDLRQLSNADLVRLQLVKNEWFARQARLILAERKSLNYSMSDAATELTALNRQWIDAPRGVRLLLTMHAIGKADHQFLWSQLNHHNEYIRSWAIRLLTEQWPQDDPLSHVRPIREDLRDHLDEIATRLAVKAVHEDSAHVRLTLASTLQRLPIDKRVAVACGLAAHAEDESDHNLPLLVWYGLIPVADQNLPELITVLTASKWPTLNRLISRRIAEELEKQPEIAAKMLAAAQDPTVSNLTTDIVMGLSEGLKGWRKARKPEGWDEFVSLNANSDETLQARLRDLNVLFGDGRALDEVKKLALDGNASIDARTSALETLIAAKPDDLRTICEPLLNDNRLNVVAAQGLAVSPNAESGKLLVNAYRRFRAPNRPQVVSLLASRKEFAKELLTAVGEGKIPREDLSAFQVRQIHSLNDAALSQLVSEVWGDLRDTPAEKQKQMESARSAVMLLSDVPALHNGRKLFEKNCQACHRLYGEGGKVGPDLTGSNRGNLDYLLENIIDPSATVNKDFRMTILQMQDGRVLNGLVIEKTEKTTTLRTATEQVIVENSEIEESKLTNLSPMPEGLLSTLNPQQVRDLLMYLQHPVQVPLGE